MWRCHDSLLRSIASAVTALPEVENFRNDNLQKTMEASTANGCSAKLRPGSSGIAIATSKARRQRHKLKGTNVGKGGAAGVASNIVWKKDLLSNETSTELDD